MQVTAEAYATARRIADGAPLVARWHKQFVPALMDPAPLTDAERDEGFACFGTEDFRTGYQAFLDKIKPEFKGTLTWRHETAAAKVGPLAGMRVIELAHIMSGPICGMMLADMGADVIKVEKIPDGDDCRRFAPILASGESASFMIVNRNKRGIAPQSEDGRRQDSAAEDARDADVVTENYRRGTMEKLGMGYDTLKAVKPRPDLLRDFGFRPHAVRWPTRAASISSRRA